MEEESIKDETLVESIVKAFVKPFNLNEAPLFRTGLIKLSRDRYLLLFDSHHIISDGTTESILVKEFLNLYYEEKLPEIKVQYKDYTIWHNELLKSDAIRKQEEYWLDVFSGEIPVLNMPTDYPRPSLQSFEGETIYFEAGEELTSSLKRLSTNTGATLYMILLSAYNILLHKYTGKRI